MSIYTSTQKEKKRLASNDRIEWVPNDLSHEECIFYVVGSILKVRHTFQENTLYDIDILLTTQPIKHTQPPARADELGGVTSSMT